MLMLPLAAASLFIDVITLITLRYAAAAMFRFIRLIAAAAFITFTPPLLIVFSAHADITLILLHIHC